MSTGLLPLLFAEVGIALAAAREPAVLGFQVDHQVVGREGGRLRVALALTVEDGEVRRTSVAGLELAQLSVRGEVRREGAVLESFEYTFNLPLQEGPTPLVIERQLRPGEYQVWVEVRDLVSRRRGEQLVPLVVAVPAALLKGDAGETSADAAKDRKILLVPPSGEALSGVQTFTALVTDEVSRVEFWLDGKPAVTRNRPPFEAPVDLGPLPRVATVTAVALDAAGAELDRAQLVINQGRERFLVRLEPISAADRRDGQVLIRAAVNVPPERRVERVELYVDDTLAAKLTAPPYAAWVPLAKESAILRAVAVLDDGAQAEDLTFLHGGAVLVTGVRVDAVELPVTVMGEDGKLVEGLNREDFEVLEDGVPQRLTHFARHMDVPIRLGLVIDTSGSMEKTLPEVQRVAMGFLGSLLRPTDRAFVVAFSDRPVLLEPFTRDFEALSRALLALRAERLTALYDALVFSLFQFSGVRGRRALVVLTDGEDNSSRHTMDQVVEVAVRSGVAIYAIGVDLGVQALRARAVLQRLARATGGETFFVATGGGLERVYARIDRELRAQYLLAYTSSSQSPPGILRKVEVRVRRPGVKVRTLPGYVPE